MSNPYYLNEFSDCSFLNNDYESLESDVSELQSNFQDGVNSIYEALISAGLTPSSTDLADIVTAIESGSFTTSSSSSTDITCIDVIDSSNTTHTTYVSSYIANYSDLTEDNFIFEVTSYTGGSKTNPADTLKITASSITKTYDAENGILTIENAYIKAAAANTSITSYLYGNIYVIGAIIAPT